MKNLNHVLFGTLAVLAVLFLTGCDNKDNPVRTSLNVDTSTLTLAVGESATRTATTKAQYDYQITYTSSNPAVATVDQTGKVTAVSEGEAVITVSMAESIKSWYTAATLTYNVVVKKLSISGAVAINAANGYSGHLTAPDGVAVTWTSSHPGILAVDANGNVTLVAYPATATDVTIAATSSSDPSVSDSKVISVSDPGIALGSATVGMIIAENGKAYTTSNYHSSIGDKVAIVAYKGTAGSVDTSGGSSGYVGLAIALKDANNGSECQWGNNSSICLSHSSLTGDAQGIDFTNTLATAACGVGHDHAAANAAKDYKYGASVAAGAHPTGTSQWFLPTLYQWGLIMTGMCSDDPAKFNEKITAAGGTGIHTTAYYWSSIESFSMPGSVSVSVVQPTLGISALLSLAYTNTLSNYVRSVLAF